MGGPLNARWHHSVGRFDRHWQCQCVNLVADGSERQDRQTDHIGDGLSIMCVSDAVCNSEESEHQRDGDWLATVGRRVSFGPASELLCQPKICSSSFVFLRIAVPQAAMHLCHCLHQNLLNLRLCNMPPVHNWVQFGCRNGIVRTFGGSGLGLQIVVRRGQCDGHCRIWK